MVNATRYTPALENLNAPPPWVVIHRAYAGAHDTAVSSTNCWCRPVVVGPEDQRTVEELIEAAKPLPN